MAEPGERARQRRLLAASLTGPFLAAAAFAQVLTVPLGVSAALAAICLVFVVGWSAAVIVAQTGSRRIAGPLALGAAVLACAVILYFAGGIASPLFLAWLPLIVETENVGRDRRFLLAGAIAAGTAVLLASMAGFLMPDLPAAGASAGHWLLPVIYAAMWFARRSGERGSMRSETDAPDEEGIDGLLDAVTLRFAGNGELSDVSAQARLLLRLEPEFLLGTGLFDRVHVSDRVHYLNALADMREGADRRSLELRVRLPRLNEGDVGAVYGPFRLELAGGAVAGGFVGFLRANDDMVRLREELETAVARAEADRSRFLSTVSHELRTPLNAIIGFSDMLLQDLAGPLANERQRDYVGLVQESGQHLLSVVNSILDLAKIQAGTYTPATERFVVDKIVATARSIVSCQARAKQVRVDVAGDQPLGEVLADKRALQQILINLLANAVKFTPEGGTVTVGGSRDDGRLELWVSDTGIGMAEGELHQIGRPFFQVVNDYTRQYEGTGLGLALVKGLVERNGGTMTIESAPGEGTTVTIAVPEGGPAARDSAPHVVKIETERQSRDASDDPLRKFA
ncbi:PAS domain-containing sensor histidine kinase [Nisaea sp.]|uniref:sensor histidine kinase n=1 Tax=Nisaea sp. TaxID=2024842 RepID=UPI00329703D6